MADNKAKPIPKPAPKIVEPEEPIPPEAMDKKQDWTNQKAADQYQKTKKFAKGGSVSSRADGCAQRGKTRGKMV